MKIAILGWGSLLWDKRSDFDNQHGDWNYDGPKLKIEFSRISSSRDGALTLVLDTENGKECQVAYTFSKRKNPDDAICDLRCKEGTILKNIGYYFADGSKKQSRYNETFKVFEEWAKTKEIDVVIWTDLESNFQKDAGQLFSVENAVAYIRDLDNQGKAAKAKEYVWHAPESVKTPLRENLQSKPWFQEQE